MPAKAFGQTHNTNWHRGPGGDLERRSVFRRMPVWIRANQNKLGRAAADIENERPTTADTVYYIGSITKVLTAALTLHLVEKTELDLDDPVAGIGDASSDNAPVVTIKQLLRHCTVRYLTPIIKIHQNRMPSGDDYV